MVTDSCPNCLIRNVHPAQVRHGSRFVRYGFECPRCPAIWVTNYSNAQYDIPNEREPEPWSA